MTDGSWWRQVWLAFIARGPYDPSGRDQEIARLRAAVPEIECPACGATIRARMADAAADDAVRALREAAQYRHDGFPASASHIQERLDVVQTAIDDLGRGRAADQFREAVKAIRRWCIDISREATARDLDDLRVVMPAILDELDRALAGESLAHARVAGPGDPEVIDTELTPVIDELRRGAGR